MSFTEGGLEGEHIVARHIRIGCGEGGGVDMVEVDGGASVDHLDVGEFRPVAVVEGRGCRRAVSDALGRRDLSPYDVLRNVAGLIEVECEAPASVGQGAGRAYWHIVVVHLHLAQGGSAAAGRDACGRRARGHRQREVACREEGGAYGLPYGLSVKVELDHRARTEVASLSRDDAEPGHGVGRGHLHRDHAVGHGCVAGSVAGHYQGVVDVFAAVGDGDRHA